MFDPKSIIDQIWLAAAALPGALVLAAVDSSLTEALGQGIVLLNDEKRKAYDDGRVEPVVIGQVNGVEVLHFPLTAVSMEEKP